MAKRKSKSIKDLVEEMTQKKNEKAKKSKEKDVDNENGDGQVKSAPVHNPEAYLSKEQYAFLQKKIKQTGERLEEQNMVVKSLQRKMDKVIKLKKHMLKEIHAEMM